MDILKPAQILDGAGDGGIGVFRQINIPGAALIQSFFKLLAADYHLLAGEVRRIAALRYSTIFLIHTNTHYTHFSEKVNKFLKKFFVKIPVTESFLSLPSHFFIIPLSTAMRQAKSPSPVNFCATSDAYKIVQQSLKLWICLNSAAAGEQSFTVT